MGHSLARTRLGWFADRQWPTAMPIQAVCDELNDLVGTGRFELPTPRTPSECSTTLSHVPTQGSQLAPSRLFGVLISLHRRSRTKGRAGRLVRQCEGGTYSEGRAEAEPKKNSSICSTRNCWAWGVQGCRRYSFRSIFCRSTHSAQAALD